MRKTKSIVLHLGNYGSASAVDYQRKIQKAIDSMEADGWELFDQTIEVDTLQQRNGLAGFVAFLLFQKEEAIENADGGWEDIPD
jgi:hypothetical protein